MSSELWWGADWQRKGSIKKTPVSLWNNRGWRKRSAFTLKCRLPSSLTHPNRTAVLLWKAFRRRLHQSRFFIFKNRNIARCCEHSWIKDGMKMKILSASNLLDVCGISSALLHMIQAWIPGDQYHWTFPRLSGLLDASPVAYFCTPPVF